MFDGFSSIWALISAKTNGIPLKGKFLSVLFNLLSVAVGAIFIIMSGDTADFTMILCGIFLVLKALSDLFIMISNKELISTVKSTINEIKHPEPAQVKNDTEHESADNDQQEKDTEQIASDSDKQKKILSK